MGEFLTGCVLVLTTCADEEEAGKISEGLVDAKLAACVSVLPANSTYWWKGRVEKSQEQLLLVKTTSARLKKIREFIKKISSYELPEIIEIDIKGEKKYLEWLRNATTS